MDNDFRRYWNILMIFLLIYVVSWVPVSICFYSDPSDNDAMVSTIVDAAFLIDIFINFISAYEDPLTALPVVSLKKIAIKYSTTWLIIDLIAVVPTQWIEKLFNADSETIG